ncbi:MAG: hypothetical protein V1847_02590 [Candidatus Diapherotrites archaeon]
MYALEYADDWDQYFVKLDKAEQERIWKKIQQLKTISRARHLRHGTPLFVVEAGQYRICFGQFGKVRKIAFAGNHKQYEKWLKT